jgi:hypothetical protein
VPTSEQASRRFIDSGYEAHVHDEYPVSNSQGGATPFPFQPRGVVRIQIPGQFEAERRWPGVYVVTDHALDKAMWTPNDEASNR